MKICSKAALFVILLLSASHIFAQQTERELGIELYQKGDFTGAVEKLKDDEDAKALHFLGLSLEKLNKQKDAAKAFEKSFKEIHTFFDRKLSNRLSLEITTKMENFSVFLKNLVPKLELGISSARHAVRLKAKMSKQFEWLSKANTLLEIVKLAKSDEIIYAKDEVETDVAISIKPRPSYTDQARQNNVKGTVTLLVVFGADGKLAHTIPLESLPHGLTEQSIKAAEKIKFESAVKDGKLVPVIKKVMFSFDIY